MTRSLAAVAGVTLTAIVVLVAVVAEHLYAMNWQREVTAVVRDLFSPEALAAAAAAKVQEADRG